MKTSCRGEHTAKWILAFLLLPASLRGRTCLSQARRRAGFGPRHRCGHHRSRRAARRRQLSRTAQQLHPSTFHRSRSGLFVWLSARAGRISTRSVQRQRTIRVVQSRVARLRARREGRLRRRCVQDQRPAQPDHSRRRSKLCRTRQMGTAPDPSPGNGSRRQ